MLYNPKWTNTTDIFSLKGLIVWLEQQPADKTYCYMNNGECLLAQYFTASGFKNVAMGGTTIDHDGLKCVPLSDEFADISVEYPRTFGAALIRARNLLER